MSVPTIGRILFLTELLDVQPKGRLNVGIKVTFPSGMTKIIASNFLIKDSHLTISNKRGNLIFNSLDEPGEYQFEMFLSNTTIETRTLNKKVISKFFKIQVSE